MQKNKYTEVTMKKILNFVLFIILLMFIFGCDSGKKGLQEKKT